jgi:hypothetical protein
MDFTTAPLNTPTEDLATPRPKYSGMVDLEDQESLAFLRSPNGRRLESPRGSLITPSSHQHGRKPSGDLYPSDQYSFSQLLNMEANLSPLDQTSLRSSQVDDDSNMTSDDLTTTLSASDSVTSAPPMTSLDPIAISIASRPDSNEKLCPLIAGQVDTCQPSRCGPDAPCMNFTTLPPIEECTSVPCIVDSQFSRTNSVENTDDMSVEVHQRPSISTRSSTNTTSRSSAPTRRFSNSTATTVDSPPDVVPLPPRRTTSARRTSKRQTRASHKAIAIPSNPTFSSENDLDNDANDNDDLKAEIEDSPPSAQAPAKQKSTAPSKLDAKQRAKQAHSLVERKYRENLNAKISLLHNTLKNSQYGPRITNSQDGEYEREDAVTYGGSGKVRKSDVLTEAMNYVNQTEVEMRHMENEISRLSDRVRVLEKLVRCDDCSLLKRVVGLQV